MRLLVIIFYLVTCTSLKAQNTLNIFTKDGCVISYSFEHKPVAKYEISKIVIKTIKDSIEFPLANLRKITFDDDVTDVEFLKIDTKNPEEVLMYDINGILVKQFKGTSNSIQTSELKKGIYIIKEGTNTFKFIKK